MRFIIAALVLLSIAACSEFVLPSESITELRPHFDVLRGGCPAPFTIIDIPLEEAPKAGTPVSPAVAADRNGDRAACYLTDQQDGKTIIVWIDNNVPLSQLGGCPNTFELAVAPSAEEGQPVGDDNGDGLICTKTTGN